MNRKFELSRRAMLRVGSIGIALPLLEPMLPRTASAQDAATPKRLVVLTKPNGCNVKELTPSSLGAAFGLTSSLEPLAALKDQLVVVSGLHNDVAGPAVNLHLAGFAALLSGIRPDGSNIAMTMDQVLAEAWRGQTSLPSLELGGDMSSGEFANNSGQICEELPCSTAWAISYGEGGQRKPTEISPQSAFDRVFAGGPPPMPGSVATPEPSSTGNEELARLRSYRKSILDHVNARTKALQARLGKSDRLKLDGYLSAIRELEQRIEGLPTAGGGGVRGPGCQGASPQGELSAYESYPARLEALLDVTALALACDATRVVTFMLAEAESEYTFDVPGVSAGDGHHGTSHHGSESAKLARVAQIDRWYVEKVAYLAAKLNSFGEGTSSVLGNTVLLHTAEMGDGDSHSYFDMPVVLVGGQNGLLPSSRHVRAEGRPIADLYLSLFNSLGVPKTSFGNGTAALTLDA